MTSGSVELHSGRWHWQLIHRPIGAALYFFHDGFADEMRTWVPLRDVDRMQVLEAARKSILRMWTDSDGQLWELSLETRAIWRPGPSASAPAAEEMWLQFRNGYYRRVVSVSSSCLLGDFTREELQRLLEQGA